MQRIKQQTPVRDFEANVFTGYTQNPRTKMPDTGGIAREYRRFVLNKAIELGAADVLSADLNPISSAVIGALKARISEHPNPLSNEVARHSKTLMEAIRFQARRDEHAQIVLGILRRTMVQAIWNPVQQRIDYHREKSELALADAMEQLKTTYDGLPYERKLHIGQLVAAVGNCHSTSDILLLIAQFRGIKSDTRDWLHHEGWNEEEERMDRLLDDVTQPQESEQFWCREMVKRMTAPGLQKYRDQAIVAAKNPDSDFEELCLQLMEDLPYDMEEGAAVVHPMQQQAPARHAMLASAEDPQDADLQTYQAYYAQGFEAQKRRRVDPPQQRVDGVPGRLDCFYWDGHQCDYEVQEDKACRFALSHREGTPTPGFKKYQSNPRPGVGAM